MLFRSDRNRVRALLWLHEGELCVCQLIELLELAPSTVSRHMTVLHAAGLVTSRREGHWIYYRLPGRGSTPAARQALSWLRRNLDDAADAADRERLQAILARPKESLCACYGD